MGVGSATGSEVAYPTGLRRLALAPAALIRLIRQLWNQGGGRDTTAHLKRLGLRHGQAIAATKLIKKVMSPALAARRARGGVDQVGAAGWRRMEATPESRSLAAFCAGLFDSKRADVMASFQPPYGFVIRYVEQGSQIALELPEEFRPIVEFCARHEIFDTVAAYIGEAPVISNVSLVYTQEHSTRIGPQLFHRDANEARQLHLVIPVWEVDHEAGPFTFLPADKSAPVIRTLRHESARIPDDVMFQHCSPSDLVECTGQPGDIYLLNPCACIHFGARTKSRPRLLLIVNLTSLFEGAEGQHAVHRAANRAVLNDGSERVRLLLNL